MPLGHHGRCFGQAGHHHSLHWALCVQSASGCFWAGLSMGQAFLEGTHLTLRSKKRLWPACVCSVWQMARELSSWMVSSTGTRHTHTHAGFYVVLSTLMMVSNGALWSWGLQVTLLKRQAKFRRHIRPYPTSSKPVGTMRQRFPSPWSHWEAERRPCEFSWYHG